MWQTVSKNLSRLHVFWSEMCVQASLSLVLFLTFHVQYSLWGNKTDLSLLVDASKIDPAALAINLAGRCDEAKPLNKPTTRCA